MPRLLSFLLKRHPVATGLLAVAVIMFLAFSWQFLAEAIYFNDPAHRERPLELWMSPRYVGQSWDLPKPVIFGVMQMDPNATPRNGPRTLADVIDRTGLTLDELQVRVEVAKDAQRSHRR